jgi:hypothetical protein
MSDERDEVIELVQLTKSDGQTVSFNKADAEAAMDGEVEDGVAEIQQLVLALRESVDSIINSKEQDKDGLLDQTFEQFYQALIMTVAGDDEDPGIVEKSFAAGLAAALPAGLAGEPSGETDMGHDANTNALLDRLAKAELTVEEQTIIKGMTPEMRADYIMNADKRDSLRKAFSPASDEVRKTLDSQAAKIDLLTKQLQDMTDEKMLSVIKSDLRGVGQAETLASSLMTVKKSDESAYAEIIKGYGAQHEQIKKGRLFSEVGNSGSVPTGDSAVAQAAAEIRKAHPLMTEPQAIAKALDMNPQLYADAAARR